MKKIICLLLCVLLTVPCLALGEGAAFGDVVEVQTITTTNGAVRCLAKTGAGLSTNQETILILKLEWENHSGKSQSFNNLYAITIYQNGIELDVEYYVRKSMDAMRKVRDGYSLEFEIGVETKDFLSPLIMEVHEIYDFNADPQEVTIEFQ